MTIVEFSKEFPDNASCKAHFKMQCKKERIILKGGRGEVKAVKSCCDSGIYTFWKVWKRERNPPSAGNSK